MLIALTALLLVVSAAAFTHRARPDMLIYGRYVEVTTPALVALGLALLSRQRTAASMSPILLALFPLSLAVVLISVAVPRSGRLKPLRHTSWSGDLVWYLRMLDAAPERGYESRNRCVSNAFAATS